MTKCNKRLLLDIMEYSRPHKLFGLVFLFYWLFYGKLNSDVDHFYDSMTELHIRPPSHFIDVKTDLKIQYYA